MCFYVAFLNFSVGVGAFVIGLSQISSFSLHLGIDQRKMVRELSSLTNIPYT